MEFLAELCTGITREEILQPQFNGLQVLNNPELHDESIPNLHAFRAVSQMMKISGITDFSTKDMIAPSAKRMRRQLSGEFCVLLCHMHVLTVGKEVLSLHSSSLS